MPLFAIVDIETTGGSAEAERITEIAIVLHDGEQTLDTYATLINPERTIPYNIVMLTGITDDMVRGAPKFYEVARKIVEMTKDAVFVAHNVRFDYSFIREEFRRLGFSYTRPQLCTVRMSREAFPGLSSYSLGNLIKHFNIKVADRHRALADAVATADIFAKIMALDRQGVTLQELVKAGVKETKLPGSLKMDDIRALPQTCGVYYMHEADGTVVYVGKSNNIQKRIIEHFSELTEKAGKMYHSVADISYEETGSELIALLLEADEIKRLKPAINRAQRAVHFPYALFSYTDELGYVRFQVAKNTAELRRKNEVINSFTKLPDGKNYLKAVTRQYELCLRLNSLDTGNGPCFDYHIKQCHGACIAAEPVDQYNERALDAVKTLSKGFKGNFLVIDHGRTADEYAIVAVTDGEYQGFCYWDKSDAVVPSEVLASLKRRKGYPDVYNIIRLHLDKNKKLKVVPF